MPRDFHALTRRGRTRRLRALALAALRAWPLEVVRLRLLSDSFNTIFRVDTAAGDKLVARVHRPFYRALDDVRLELRWLEALGRDGTVPAPRPLKTRDGALVVSATHDGVPGPRMVSVISWVAGQPLGKRLHERGAQLLGAAAAALHADAEGRADLTAGAPVVDRLYMTPPLLLADTPAAPLSPRFDELLRAANEHVEARFARRRRDGSAAILCHGDLHPWNALVSRARLSVVDFDDCVVTWPAFDLGIAAFYIRAIRTPEQSEPLVAAFRRGYERRRPWPTDDAELNDFVMARQLVLLDKLADERDPDLRALLPGYLEKAEQRLRAWLPRP